MILRYIVENNCNLDINQILKQKLNCSNRLMQKLIKNNLVSKNDEIIDTRLTCKSSDIITINLDYEENSDNIVPTNIPLNIVFEDDSFLIINKPAGIAVHPSMFHFDNTLSNGVKYYFEKIGLKKKIRPVNRLDFYTSGLIIFAKNEYIQECLISQMKENIFKKEYICIVNGILKEKNGTINLPIARKENSIIERCVSENGQTAITHYEVLKEFDNYSLLKCKIDTGRTHQIRVHMSSIGHPILGDTLYGISSSLINRQALHCYKISFVHPITKEILTFECELPNDMIL